MTAQGGNGMFRVGIDIGGTFTDLFAWNDEEEIFRTGKVLSTPTQLTRGVFGAIEAADVDLSEVDAIVHGSTIATNALIERKFPPTALIATEGFRDTIEIGRAHRHHLYDPYQRKSVPLIARRLRFSVPERMGADGEPVESLDEDAARRVIERLRELGVKGVAITFLNSYANGAHERRMAELCTELVPGVSVAVSCETRPKVRELGRFVTTAVRACLYPVVEAYLSQLEEELHKRGFRGRLYLIKSNGGLTEAKNAKERPEELIGSGPAGGVAAAIFLGGLRGHKSTVSTDMGGTSYDACLIEDGRGLVTDEYELEWDMPLVNPMLDIRSIGAGGGSIAWIDPGGSLRVGPQSAGSDPGPACYLRGGEEPTVTDANLILGRIDPTLGGKLRLSHEAAEAAVGRLAERLEITGIECASAIVDITSHNMAAAIRMVSTDRGRDPREQVVIAFGGAGGLHVYEVAREVGIREVFMPALAGVASAFGALLMEVRHDVETTFYVACTEVNYDELNKTFEVLEQKARALLEADGANPKMAEVDRSAQMRYIGQSYEVLTRVPSGHLDKDAVEGVIQEFHAVHRREYGVASDTLAVAFVNLRVTAVGTVGKSIDRKLAKAFENLAARQDAEATKMSERDVYFDGEAVPTRVLQSMMLPPRTELEGPLIVEESDSALVIPPGARGEVDSWGNLVVHVESEV